MSQPITVLVVDDEELARVRLKGFLDGIEGVRCVGQAENGLEAVEKVRELAPDVLVLDIQMPGLDGFGVVEALEDAPLVIFATAYDEYAIRAFEVNSIDYLLKPVSKERLGEAIERARTLLASGTDLEEQTSRIAELVRARSLERLTVQKGKKIVLLDYDDVIWIEAADELVFAHTSDDRYLVNTTMAELERRLDPAVFFRIHRSTIVNLNHVVEIVPWFSGKYRIAVDDAKKSELVLSRVRARRLREILHF